MRMLTVPTHTDEELELPMPFFRLKDIAPPRGHHRVCVDSGAARSACPQSYAADRPTVSSSRQLAFQTASGEILDHYGSKMVPYDLGNFGHLGINYEVTDVNGPVAAVSSMNDSGLTVVFTPNGSWVCSEAPPRPTERVDMVRESRIFWLDVPRSVESQLSHLMPLKLEQAAAPVPAGRPADEAAAAELQQRAGGIAGGDQPMDDGVPAPKRRPQSKGPTEDERTNHELSHVVFRSWCRHCVSTWAKEDLHRRTESHEGGVPKIMVDWLFFLSDSEPNVMLPVFLAYDLTLDLRCRVRPAGRQRHVDDHRRGDCSGAGHVGARGRRLAHGRRAFEQGPCQGRGRGPRAPHFAVARAAPLTPAPGAGRGHFRGVPGHFHREQAGFRGCDRQDHTYHLRVSCGAGW